MHIEIQEDEITLHKIDSKIIQMYLPKKLLTASQAVWSYRLWLRYGLPLCWASYRRVDSSPLKMAIVGSSTSGKIDWKQLLFTNYEGITDRILFDRSNVDRCHNSTSVMMQMSREDLSRNRGHRAVVEDVDFLEAKNQVQCAFRIVRYSL